MAAVAELGTLGANRLNFHYRYGTYFRQQGDDGLKQVGERPSRLAEICHFQNLKF